MSSIPISPEEVKCVAKLARIALTPEEETIFTSQLAPVLEHISHLNLVNTDNVAPTFQTITQTNIFQTGVSQTLTQVQALSNAPRSSDGYFVVPKTIDK